MAANSDQIRRDAEHAARAEITLYLSKYQRRAYEAAKAVIADRLARADGDVDGTQLGRDAAFAGLEGLTSGDDVGALESGEAPTAS